MNFEALVPFIKLALSNSGVEIKPEEIMAELQSEQDGKANDKDPETVDAEMLDASQPQGAEIDNDEGKLLENSFKELEVENAIEKVKEKKQIEGNQPNTEIATDSIKIGTVWDCLKLQYQ